MFKKSSSSILTIFLLLIASGWLIVMLWGNVQQLWATTLLYSYWRLLAALPLTILILYLTAITYYFIQIEIATPKTIFLHLFLPYLRSQIVRYLPGKVWGVLYQAREMKEKIPAHAVWEANFTQFTLGTLLSLIAISWVFIRQIFSSGTASLVLFLLISGFCLLLWKKWVHLFIRFFAQRFFPKHKIPQNLSGQKKSLLIFSSLLLEWVAYFLVWIVLLYSHHSFDDIIVLSILYIASWLIGFATLVVPGGILVRESAFISLGTYFGFDSGILAFYAILARVLFSISDIAGVLIAHAIFRKTK